jgi:hypothetical protein
MILAKPACKGAAVFSRNCLLSLAFLLQLLQLFRGENLN